MTHPLAAARPDPAALHARQEAVRARRVGVFTALLALLGLALAAGLPWPTVLDDREVLAGIALAVAFAVGESLVLHVEIADDAHSASVVELPLVVGLLLVDPMTVVAARLLGGAVALALVRRQSGSKLAFNLAAIWLEVVVAALAYRAVADLLPGGGVLSAWAAVLVAAVAGAVLSTSCVVVVISLSVGRSQFGDLPTVQRGSALTAAATGTLGLVAVLVLRTDGAGVLPLLVLGALAVAGYRQHTRLARRHERLSTLHGFVRQVSTQAEARGTVPAILAQTLELMRGEVAVLTQVLPTEAGREGADPGLRLQTSTLTVGGELVVRQLWAGPGDWPVARCLSSGAPLLGARGTRDPAVEEYLAQQGVRDGVLVALPGADGPTGTLFVGSRRSDWATFEQADVLALEGVAGHAAVALHNGRLVDRLTHESRHDALTGLPNRAELQARLAEVLARGTSSTAVLFMDLDRFKDVNDTLGHSAGDRVLSEVAERLSQDLPAGSTIARLGGDEFAVVLPGAGLAAALRVAQRLRRLLERPVAVEGVSVDVGVSIGVSLAPRDGDTPGLLMRRADIAMYDAKHSSGIAAYDPGRDESSTSRLALVAQLRTALAEEQFRLEYQPQVAGETGAPVRFEALLRWQHPTRGTVGPDEFVAVAERAGLLQELTAWVLGTALDAVTAWRAAGHDLGVAVNLSPRNLLDPGLPSAVRRALAVRALPAEVLTLEITESTIMAEPARAVETLRQLRSTGVRLSVDDFGTGYSSLAYLKQLPVDEVKIDKSFVRGLPSDAADVAIVRAVLALAASLGLDVVAEGVEDDASRGELRRLGCGLLQGYRTGRPMPSVAVLPWLDAGSDRPLRVVRPSRRASV